jgi:hypothetical protein
VGIVGHLLIVGRMALAAIHGGQRLMVFLNRLGVTFEALKFLVNRRRMVIRRFFMAFRALRIGVTVPRSGLCRDRRRMPNENCQNDDRNDGCFHFYISGCGNRPAQMKIP